MLQSTFQTPHKVMKIPILRLYHPRLAPFCDCKNVTAISIRRHALNFAKLYSDDDIQTIHSKGMKERSNEGRIT
jgi:hypothetical protein